MAIFAAAGLCRRAVGLISASAAEPSAYGAILPNGAHQVGKDRYQSPSGFGETLKFYSKVYSVEHYPRKAIADLPGVRAIHLANTGDRGEWEGAQHLRAQRVHTNLRAAPEPEAVVSR